jgi:hypothetical protein
MKFDGDFNSIFDEIGGVGDTPFKNNEEENIYQLLKPYLEGTSTFWESSSHLE